MIDIIIPAYNAHKTIRQTLLSIARLDNVKDVKVYIANDVSDKDYSEEVKAFQNLMFIKELKLPKNSGCGQARQYAMDRSNSEYVLFIDADDVFYDERSVSVLKENIKGADFVRGAVFVEEAEGGYVNYEDEFTIHGKLYKRNILEKNNIRFMKFNSKEASLHEDISFNTLYQMYCKNINVIDDVVYTYKYVSTSITKTEDFYKNVENFVHVLEWTAQEVEKRTIKNYYETARRFCFILYNCFFNYSLEPEYFQFMFKELSTVKKIYLETEKYLDYSEKAKLYNSFYSTYGYVVIPEISFYEFLDRIE